jgi:hypothetical protein
MECLGCSIRKMVCWKLTGYAQECERGHHQCEIIFEGGSMIWQGRGNNEWAGREERKAATSRSRLEIQSNLDNITPSVSP